MIICIRRNSSNWKFIFVKYLRHYFQTQGKNVLLIATIGPTTLQLSQHACTIHTQFRIHVYGYLYVLPQPSNILQSLKYANVIINDDDYHYVMCNRTTIKTSSK
jgi:hypothetical protein